MSIFLAERCSVALENLRRALLDLVFRILLPKSHARNSAWFTPKNMPKICCIHRFFA